MKNSFPVVCIGMSSGAIGPLKTLFRQISPATGMAFVVIHHMRQFPTNLPFIIGGCTKMPVSLASPEQIIRPNQVYVLPSGTEIKLRDGHFSVQPRSKPHGWANVISLFLTSLVKSRHPAIAVILSGLDKDGADALQQFQQSGGIVIVQQPETARIQEMPANALETGHVNYVLPPQAMAAQLESSARSFSQTIHAAKAHYA